MARRASPVRHSAASPPVTALAHALHAAAVHLLRRLRVEDARAGVSAATLSALSVLVFGGPRRLTDLAAAEQVRPPTMTRLIAAMEAGGLVRRRPDAADARAVRLEATAQGTRLLKAGRRRRVDRLAQAIRRLPGEERAVLARAAGLLERISRDLKNP
jgi:DNA-binding MarR family transcriptional regulator